MKRPISSTAIVSSSTLYTSKEAEERSMQKLKRRQVEIAQNRAKLAETMLLERQEENLQKQLEMHKKLLSLLGEGSDKVKKMKDILEVQKKLKNVKLNLQEILVSERKRNNEIKNLNQKNEMKKKPVDEAVAKIYDDYDEEVDYEDDSD